MNAHGARPSSLTGLDIAGLTLAGLELLWAVFAAFKIQPVFSLYWADIGAPRFTFHAQRGAREWIMGLSIFSSVALPGVFWCGLHLPPFGSMVAIK